MRNWIGRIAGWEREDPDHPQHVESKRVLIGAQLVYLAIVGLCFLLWAILEPFWPAWFSPFEWSNGTADLVGSVIAFWPFLAWGVLMATISLFNLIPTDETGGPDEEHVLYDTISSTLAGVWEELGYRCVFILLLMVLLAFCNLIWSWLLIVITVVLVVFCFVTKDTGDGHFFGGAFGLAVTVVVLCLTWTLEDPVYWIYRNIFFNVLHWVSFAALDPILYFENAPALFVMAAVSSNARFRDGHKYQGPIGQLHAWMAGFILLYAMLYHGLMTAIVVHALYDIEFAIIRYIGRKVDRLQEG